MQNNGVLQLFKRIGTPFAGFPVTLNGGSNSPVFLKKGSNLANTSLTLLSDDGQHLRVNLVGKILFEAQLPRLSVSTKFRMVPDLNQTRYLILRHDEDMLSVFSQEGNVLFELPQFLSKDFEAQYYILSAAEHLLVLHDKSKQLSYFYNLSGQIALPSPIQSGRPVTVLHSQREKSHTIFRIHNKSLLKMIYIAPQ